MAAEPALPAVLAECFEALGQPSSLGERWAALAKPLWIVTAKAAANVLAEPPSSLNNPLGGGSRPPSGLIHLLGGGSRTP